MRFILSTKFQLSLLPITSNRFCYTKMADQGIEILFIQDSDLELGTQGMSSRLNEAYILQTRNGEHRTDVYSKATEFYSILI